MIYRRPFDKEQNKEAHVLLKKEKKTSAVLTQGREKKHTFFSQ
jgi:hypothetical protein